MLDGEIDEAKAYLMGKQALNQGDLRLRKERLLRVDTLVLSFESPVDLAFINVDYGQIQLDNGLRPGQGSDEPTGLVSTTLLRGRSGRRGSPATGRTPRRVEHQH